MVLLNRILFVGIITTLCIFLYDVSSASQKWNEGTYKKYNHLVSMGFEPKFAVHLINECKNSAKDPVHCIKI